MTRARRLRSSQTVRNLVKDTDLSASSLIYPLFVIEGRDKKEPISSLPGQYRYSLDMLEKEARSIRETGPISLLIFGMTDKKDATGSYALGKGQIVNSAISVLKGVDQNFLIFTDVCLCGYTDHGQCGVLKENKGQLVVDNDETLKLLAEMACSHAEAGADFVAPSAMMDFQVKAIRQGLDSRGYHNVGIMSYSAKFLSCFYGPFREATGNAPKVLDRSTYQVPPNHRKQALLEIETDINEGADIVMVKPSLLYLDIICEASKKFNVPIAAYNVSGEYAMLKAAVEKGWLDEKKALIEMFTALRRAGADIVISYHARDIARILRG